MSEGQSLSMFPTANAAVETAQAASLTPVLESLPDPLQGKDFLAHEFLLWLWFRSERDFGAFNLPGGPVDLWFDDRMHFLAQEEKRVSSAFNGGAPSTTPEARLSILSGKVISEARLGIRRGEHEWTFLLRVRGGDLQLHGLKIPAQLKEGLEEMVLERSHLLRVINEAIQYLFELFVDERTDERWSDSVVPELTRWLMGEGG